MSTVISDSGARGFNPSVVGGSGTGKLVFPSILGPSFNNGGNSTANASVAVDACQVLIGPQQASEGQVFSIVGAGNVNMNGTSPTVQFYLYAKSGAGISLTSTNDTLIASTSALSLPSDADGLAPFYFKIDGQGDANSGKIQFGSATLYFNGTSETFTIASSGVPLTSQDLLTTYVSFGVAVQFAVGNASNAAYLQQLQVSQ
jgi:hypothetical protein